MNLMICIGLMGMLLAIYREEKISTYVVTPIVAMAFPYTLIMAITVLLEIGKGEGLNVKVLLYSFIYIFLFGIIGVIIKGIFKIDKIKKSNYNLRDNIKTLRYERIYDILIKVMLMYILIFYISKFGFNIPDLGILKSTFSMGIVGHIRNITSMLILIKYAANINRNNGSILPFVWIIFLLITASKYTMLMYCIAMLFIYVFLSKKKINIVKLSIIALIISTLFVIVYISRFLSQGYKLSEISYEFIFNHYLYYLSGSFYAYSQIIELGLTGGIGYGILLAPLINIISLFTNEPMISTVAEFVTVNTMNGYSRTNVFTMFGAFQYEVGVLGAILLIILLAVYTYINYYNIFIKKDIITLVIGAYFCSLLFFNFFNSFYGTFNVWESIIFLYIIKIVEKIKIKR